MSEPSNLVDLLSERAAADPGKNLYTFLENGERESTRLSRGELLVKAQALAARLQLDGGAAVGKPVERALLVHPPGLDLITAFWACLCAGVAAVPAFPPRGRRNLPRLLAIAKDARPRWILCAAASLPQVRAWVEETRELHGVRILATDDTAAETDMALASRWRPPALGPHSLAFLQYTSGSTSEPKGVMVGHGNLMHNLGLIARAFHQQEGPTVLGWLPLHHDMGLIGNVLQPLFSGGRAILMPPAAFLQKPSRWLRAISRYRAHTSGGPNFAYDLCIEKVGPQERAELDLRSWRVAFNGAEPVRARTLAAFAEAFEPCGFARRAFFPCFGLAEATLLVAAGGGGASSSSPAPGPVSCGPVAPGFEVLIVQPGSKKPCRPEVEGEVWLAGGSVAGGYWQNQEATAETFKAYLASGEGPFLRSGDLGFLAGGELFITGRLKDLIILRGRNFYPQDVELTAGESHRDLEPRGGAAFAVEVAGEERLVVVHEVRRRLQAPAREVATAVRQAVAEVHEVQAHEVVLIRTGSLPRTTSGKVRRRACAEAWRGGTLAVVLVSSGEGAGPGQGAAGEAPQPHRDDLLALPREERRETFQRWLLATVAQALRQNPASLETSRSLAALGFDSLAVAELRHRMEEVLGAAPSWEQLMADSTLEQLSEELLEALEVMKASPALALVAGGWVGEAELSHGQRGLWLHNHLFAGRSADHLSFAARLRGPSGRAALDKALCRWVARHGALRATFSPHDGMPRQLFSQDVRLSLSATDAAAWDASTLARRLAEVVEEPFDLEHGPLVRAQVFERGGEGDVFLFVAHHIVMDLTSLFVLLREFEANEAADQQATEEIIYADFVRWQREHLASAAGTRHWRYWQQRLEGFDPLLAWPSDRPRPALASHRGAEVPATLPAELVASLEGLAARAGTTLYTVLLAALQVFLHRLCGQQDLVVGSPFSGRTRPQLARLVGYLVNPLPLRADLSANPTFDDFLAQAAEGVVGALEHQDFPATLLVEKLAPRRDPGRHPLFQTFFALENARREMEDGFAPFLLGQAEGRAKLGEFAIESVALPTRSTAFDLTCRWVQSGTDLLGQWVYSTDLFEPVTVERWAKHFRCLLLALIDSPQRRVSNFGLLDRAGRHQLLLEWNDTALPPADEVGMHQAVRAQARRTPEAIALVFGDAQWSYQQLTLRIDGLARRLRERGVAPESCVGLALERGPEMVFALLAVLEAGAAFLPLDPSLPTERLAMMAADARISLLLTPARARRILLGYGGEVLAVGEAEEESSAGLTSTSAAAFHADQLAYVLFTSGTTGRPKGVMISHAAVMNFLSSMAQRPSLGAPDSLLAVTTLSFDISLLELLLPLLVGARVEVASRALAADGRQLVQRLARSRTTAMQATPATWRMMLEAGWRPPAGFVVLCGGEALPEDLAHALAGEESQLWNLYGPTETTIWSATAPIVPPGPVTAGRPIAQTQLQIVSRHLELVPRGAVGELTIGGRGLTRGYLRRAALTAEKLVPDPQAHQLGARLYRTGDLARFGDDGRLEILGRIDHQVKLRGFRIELGEIEAVLRHQQTLADAAVVAREDVPGHLRLVAWVVPTGQEMPAVEELRQELSTRLPSYMIPSLFLPLAKLPLTSSGKVDRLALARRELPDGEAKRGGSAPTSETQKLLAALWQELLSQENVHLEDNFFELGGDSILGVRLASRAAAVGLELTPLMLLENQTLGELAAVVQELPVVEQEQPADATEPPAADEVLTEVDLGQAQLDKIFGKFG